MPLLARESLPAAPEAEAGGQGSAPVLFVRLGCATCEETEALLDELGIAYDRWVVGPTPIPGKLRLHHRPTGQTVMVPKAALPAVPALWEPAANVLHVGDAAIARAARSWASPAHLP